MILELKLATAALLFGCGIAGGMLPWWVHSGPQGTRWLGRGIAFAGGVLLGAGLIHLLAEASAEFKAAWPASEYPWAMLFAASSFLALLFIERVAPRMPRVPVGSSPNDGIRQMLDGIDAPGHYPFLLLLALSVHSLLAGLALGAQGTLSSFAVVFIAVMAHKASAGFALGASLHRIGISRSRALRLVAGFAIMTPLGLFLGTLVSLLVKSQGALLFEAFFDAIAAGAFLYIATFDVIREEFLPPPPDRLSKWFAAMLGLILMGVIAVWT